MRHKQDTAVERHATANGTHPAPATPLPQLAAAIEEAHAKCVCAVRAGVEYALKVGELLCEAKRQVGHGNWLDWLAHNVSFSERTARDYMRVSRGWETLANRQLAADLTIREALTLLSGPDDETTLEEDEETHDALREHYADVETDEWGNVLPGQQDAEDDVPDRAEPDVEEGEPEAQIGGQVPICQDGGATTPPAGQSERPRESAPEEEDAPADEDGLPVPEQALAAFAEAAAFRKACHGLDELAREVERLGKSPAGLHMHWQSIHANVRNARASLHKARPSHACPYCGGARKSCTACKGHGWVTDLLFNGHPDHGKARE